LSPGRRGGSDARQLGVLLAPYLLGSALLVILPAAVTFGLAAFEYDLLTSPRLVGLDNFEELVGDPRFHQAAAMTAILVALAVPLRLAGAFAAALLLHARFRGAGPARTAAYLPSVLPDVAYGLLWLYLLNPLYGPTNAFLRAVGLPEPEWLTSTPGAIAAVVLLLAFTIGEGFIVCLAARQEISTELYDLARVEGSSVLHTLRRVTAPLMAPTLWLLALRDVAFLLQASFVPALVVTGGGPGRSTEFLPLLVFRTAFEDLRYGYAATINLTMFLITAVLVGAQWRLLRRWRPEFGR
jgi:multiple sugar transport system permease protein